MQVSNSFWREVLDYLPGLIMLFRIDDQEHAQLMFVNEAVRNVLGYKPEEFILASESASHVQTQVESLVDTIAKNTHGTDGSENECIFFSKQGDEVLFTFTYQLLRLKSSRNPFIAVELHPQGTIPASQSAGIIAGQDSSEGKIIAESELMQAILAQMENLVDIGNNVVFRGESSTGKTTLARKFLRMVSLQGVAVYEINAKEPHEVVSSALSEISNVNEPNHKAALLLLHFQELTQDQQQLLLSALQKLKNTGFDLRIVSTTNVALETMMESGRIDAKLYYQLGFQQIFIPPLRKRKEDIKAYMINVLPEYAGLFGMSNITVPSEQVQKAQEYDWPGNWKEFLDASRKSIAAIGSDGILNFAIGDDTKATKQTTLFPESEDKGTENILTFDEMNKSYLQQVLELTKGKIYGEDGAAELLELKPTTLQSKLKKLGIR